MNSFQFPNPVARREQDRVCNVKSWTRRVWGIVRPVPFSRLHAWRVWQVVVRYLPVSPVVGPHAVEPQQHAANALLANRVVANGYQRVVSSMRVL